MGAQTLDGVWDVTVFTYKDYAATEALFFDWFIAEPTITPLPDKTPVIQRLAPLFGAMAGGKSFAIVLARPEDQDFDILNINEGPGWVFDLQIVQVKEGTEGYEVTMISYKSRAARQRAIEEAGQFREFQQFGQTFDCVACALMVENRRPEYFPPFSD